MKQAGKASQISGQLDGQRWSVVIKAGRT